MGNRVIAPISTYFSLISKNAVTHDIFLGPIRVMNRKHTHIGNLLKVDEIIIICIMYISVYNNRGNMILGVNTA